MNNQQKFGEITGKLMLVRLSRLKNDKQAATQELIKSVNSLASENAEFSAGFYSALSDFILQSFEGALNLDAWVTEDGC